MDMMLKIFGHL